MASVTLTTLISRARSRADMPSTSFVTDSEVTAWLNEGHQALHEKLIEAYGEHYVFSTSALTTIAGTIDYSLPSDFFKLYGVDLTYGGRSRSLKPYPFNERNFFKNQNTTWYNIPRYALLGSNIRFQPDPGNTSGTLNYAPVASTLSSGSDTVNYPNGWEKYIVVYAAIRMLNKEESNSNDLRDELDRFDKELRDIVESRDSGLPKQVTDMEAVNFYDDWFFPS